jgi:hypothetical protein
VKPADIDRFFEDLNLRLDRPVQIVLTGGAAGILQGVKRVTLDIDFEITLKAVAANPSDSPDAWDTVQEAIASSAQATGIAAQYAENIDQWSSIALPAKRSRLYRRFGKVEVRILDPALWAIGKLVRYLSTDLQDLKTVLKSANRSPGAVVKLWGTALGMSPASSSQAVFRRQVENFLDQYSREIWGKRQDPKKLKEVFLHSARKTHEKKTSRK